jgi:hypothetical protein
MKSENQQAVDTALTCLRLFGIDIPTHPTWEQVRPNTRWPCQTLNGRPIESLIDLPMMTDPEVQATGAENLQEVEGVLSYIVKGVDRVNRIIVRMRALSPTS